MSDESLQDLLRALAETDASVEASPEIEIRLRNQFRSRNRQRMRRQGALWAASAAALVALVFGVASRKSELAPASPVVLNAPTVTLPQVQAPVISQTTGPRKPIAPRQRPRQEIVTPFFPLMNPAPPFERGQLMRIELPASAMQMVGLPVHEEHLADPVQADVLLGEEGLPRAIRFVRFESK